MGFKPEVELHFSNDTHEELIPYIARAQAGGLGEFLLQAFNFYLDELDQPPFDPAKCVVENHPPQVKTLEDGRRITVRKVKIFFDDQQTGSLEALLAAGNGTPSGWLRAPLESYTAFLHRFLRQAPTRSADGMTL